MSESNKQKWLQKAQIDYFPPFMNLWLAFNIWYRNQYKDEYKGKDRDLINYIKEDTTQRNHFLNNLTRLLTGGVRKESIRFRSDLEQFHYALEQSELIYQGVTHDKKLSFEYVLLNYDSNRQPNYVDLLEKSESEDSIQLDEIYITNEFPIIMAGLLEIIYQIRCYLFHGDLEPDEANHEVVKYAYCVFYALMP